MANNNAAVKIQNRFIELERADFRSREQFKFNEPGRMPDFIC
jgi:hypothetical protein